MRKRFLTLFLAAIWSAPFLVAEELNYNLYSLQASVSEEIANDLLVVSLVATHQAKTAQEASDSVNQDMAWALDQIEELDEITSRTEQYNTYPQYRNEKIQSWTVSQNLRLESDDFELLTDAVGGLQERLQVQSMSFSVKSETRAEVENSLITDALAAYRTRAGIVAESMQAESYDMVNTNINTQNAYSPISVRNRGDSFMSLKEVAVPVSVESGESTLTVSVNGQIQLVF